MIAGVTLVQGCNCVIMCCQGRMGDVEYLAAFQQIVMPVAYEVCVSVSCLTVISSAEYAMFWPRVVCSVNRFTGNVMCKFLLISWKGKSFWTFPHCF